MSGLQLTKDVKDSLRFLMNATTLNSTYELEGIISSDLTAEQFKKIIGRLNGNFKESREVERLDITFARDSKYSNTRISIIGFHDINKFCRTEKLDGIRNLVIEEKKPASERINRLFIDEYNIRFNLKQELKLNRDLQHIKELFLPSKWREISKVFRYKKIYQFVTEDGFSIDCSIVRSSQLNNQKMTVNEILKRGLVKQVIKPDDVSEPFGKWWNKLKSNKQAEVMVKNAYTFFKSVKESKVFENIMTYEVEVEYIGNTVEETQFVKTKLKDKADYLRVRLVALFKYIGIILQCIQNSFYLTTTSEQHKLKTEYLKMLKSDNPALFIGALPVDLQHINCIEIPDNLFDKITEPNIILDYAVCQKIDGERALMYVDKHGECYLITRANETGMRKVGMNLGQKYANSLFDGEYLEYDMDGELLNKLILFDCYVISGKVMIDHVFGDDKSGETSRYYHIKQLEKYYSGDNNDITVMNGLTKYAFKLGFINYLFGEKSSRKVKNHQLIFQQSATILNKMNVKYGGTLQEGHLFSYPTDGLIFMPTNRPLYNFQICDQSGNNRAMVCNRKVAAYFKWKPIDKLTIDFRVNFVKTSKKERVIHYENGVKYAEITLKCRNYDSFVYNKSGKQTVNSNISSHLVNENRNLYKEAAEVNFISVQPFQGVRDVSGALHNTLYTAYLKVNDDNNVCCLNGDIIYDNDVVEMAYMINENTNDKLVFKSWIPERVRPGKVPNALNTAIDIWKLIHYNLSKDNIMNGLTMADMNEISSSYNLQLSKKTDLQSFIDHSKKYLIEKFLSGMTQPRIADFGCNNMDYFLKLVVHNPSLILGLDNNNDVLNNKKSGAGSLILNLAGLSPKVRKVLERTMLVDADLTKSLSTGEAGEHSISSSYYLDILYGRYKPELTENAKLTALYNQAGAGFNMVLAFNVLEEISTLDDSLDTFLNNVASNLRSQGYFIGTMLDGEKVETLFNSTNKLNILSGENMTWLLEKSEVDSAEVNVYYNYYNTLRRNYIIKPRDLVAKCAEFGLRLIDSKSLSEDLSELKSSFKGNIEELMKDREAEGWINLQRYFIFQKSGDE